MGTEVLPALDFLAHYQRHPNADFMGLVYHQKFHQHSQYKKKSGDGHGFSPQKAKVKGEIPEKKRPLKPKPHEQLIPEVGKRTVNRTQKATERNSSRVDDQTLKKKPAKNPLWMGKVTILKRGQTLKPNNYDSSQLEFANKTTDQLFISPAEFLRPDPTLLPKGRTMKSRSVLSKESEEATPPGLETEIAEGDDGIKTPNFPVFISEKWAGPAFPNSPSPSALPLPRFSIKKPVGEMAEIDRFATRDLRRLLGLD